MCQTPLPLPVRAQRQRSITSWAAFRSVTTSQAPSGLLARKPISSSGDRLATLSSTSPLSGSLCNNVILPSGPCSVFPVTPTSSRRFDFHSAAKFDRLVRHHPRTRWLFGQRQSSPVRHGRPCLRTGQRLDHHKRRCCSIEGKRDCTYFSVHKPIENQYRVYAGRWIARRSSVLFPELDVETGISLCGPGLGRYDHTLCVGEKRRQPLLYPRHRASSDADPLRRKHPAHRAELPARALSARAGARPPLRTSRPISSPVIAFSRSPPGPAQRCCPISASVVHLNLIIAEHIWNI